MASWQPKDARQYEHIKESAIERGQPEAKAQELAARSINNRRRKLNRTETMSLKGRETLTLPLRSEQSMSFVISRLNRHRMPSFGHAS